VEFLEKQADFIHRLSYSCVPDPIINAAKRIILDAIGCMAAGSVLSPYTELPSGESTIIGRREKSNREWASFLNGLQMVAIDMDEGNQSAKGHPLSHIIAPLLAEAEKVGCTGKEFLIALIAAYEVTSRWGTAMSLKDEVHPHGNWGTVGGAVAIEKLRGSSKEHIVESMIVANSLPITTAWTSALSGANVRNAYIGMSNLIGLMAPDMVTLGVRSNEAVLNSVYGSILGSSMQLEHLDQDLGEDWYIQKNYIKLYATCRYIHGAIDALESLKNTGVDISPNVIESVHVETYQTAAQLNAQEAANAFAAKFSIPISLGIWFCRGSVDPEHFTDAIVVEQDIRHMASKVTVAADPEFSSLFPAVRGTRVIIRLKDGTELIEEATSNSADITQAVDDSQVINKFFRLASLIWDEEQCNQILNYVLSLEKKEEIAQLFELLSIQTE
jgi:2-methylcitrate dehydratase PrpD